METQNKHEIVDSVEKLEALLARVREAEKIFATYSQEQVDKIFKAAAIAANKARIPLAKMAVEETGMGVVEDKIIKNHYAAEYIYNAYKNTKTCGVIEEDSAFGMKKVCRIFGIYLIFVAIFTALLGFFFNREFFTAYFICVLAGAFICIAAVVLTCRKKSE